ncbi:MAG: hypothetical protein L0287_03010 [Anaerolineae bacterium]|nr:hypothetical protein [Anaerolineae bacterium]
MPNPSPNDVLLCWNRHGYRDEYARRYELAGAKVIIAENGWIGAPKGGGKFYALCFNQHNGLGHWPTEACDRLERLNIELMPWRKKGGHIVILAQRGIGPKGVRMEGLWPSEVIQRLKKYTKRQVVFRGHPGNDHHLSPPLTDVLNGAHAVVTWGSGAAIKALAYGIPVFYELKGWIGAGCSKFGITDLENPFLGDRYPTFNRLAWAQWTAKEIGSGEAYRCLGL